MALVRSLLLFSGCVYVCCSSCLSLLPFITRWYWLYITDNIHPRERCCNTLCTVKQIMPLYTLGNRQSRHRRQTTVPLVVTKDLLRQPEMRNMTVEATRRKTAALNLRICSTQNHILVECSSQGTRGSATSRCTKAFILTSIYLLKYIYFGMHVEITATLHLKIEFTCQVTFWNF